MRIELNLATRPTENRRRFFVLAGTGVVVLLLLAIIQAVSYVNNWGSGRDVARRTAVMRDEVNQLESDQKSLEQTLQQPQAREVMQVSYFLNSLITVKSISWTKIFMDLEKLTPDQVQVQSVHPELLENNQVRLDMVIAADSSAPLLEFVQRVEKSDQFGTPTISAETYPAQGTTDKMHRLALSVLYAQK